MRFGSTTVEFCTFVTMVRQGWTPGSSRASSENAFGFGLVLQVQDVISGRSGGIQMFKCFSAMMLLAAFSWSALAVEQRHGVVLGEITKLDAAGKTVVVKTADGTSHTFHFLERTAVHGGRDVAAGSKDAFHGLKEGTEVAVHYTVQGTEETAREIDTVGKDGLKAADVTVVHLDRSAKTLAVKTADGTEETFRMTGRAVEDTGEEIGKGAEKSVKGTVYYTDEAGHKVAHYFKRAI